VRIMGLRECIRVGVLGLCVCEREREREREMCCGQ
jgi:hypothetical protein